MKRRGVLTSGAAQVAYRTLALTPFRTALSQ